MRRLQLKTSRSHRPCWTIIGLVFSKSLYRNLTDGQNGSKPTLSSRKTMLFGSTKILHPEEFGPLVGSWKHMWVEMEWQEASTSRPVLAWCNVPQWDWVKCLKSPSIMSNWCIKLTQAETFEAVNLNFWCLVPIVDGTLELQTFTDASLSALSAVACNWGQSPLTAQLPPTTSSANPRWHQSNRWAFPNWSSKQLNWEQN